MVLKPNLNPDRMNFLQHSPFSTKQFFNIVEWLLFFTRYINSNYILIKYGAPLENVVSAFSFLKRVTKLTYTLKVYKAVSNAKQPGNKQTKKV